VKCICIKAGPKALAIIRDGGFDFDRICAYFGPGAGPRWLVASGFDLSLLENGLLGRKQATLLVGSSAGAWRLAAWLLPEAEKCYRNLREAYISATYKRSDTPEHILDTLGGIINAYIEDDALPFAMANKQYRLAVITARARNLVSSEVRWIQYSGLALAFLFNAMNRSNLPRFAERVVFYHGPKPPAFCLRKDFEGSFVALSEVNFKQAVLASGAIPLVVAGVRDIYGAPRGIYRDGGLLDYHLTHNYSERADDLVLFFHHQERLIPGWLDKKLQKRKPPASALENVVMVHLAPDFISTLPSGKVPDRDDVTTYIDDPQTRIRNWRQAVEMCSPIGEEFLEIAASGKIRDVTEPLAT
jgi:hypothetical protein